MRLKTLKTVKKLKTVRISPDGASRGIFVFRQVLIRELALAR